MTPTPETPTGGLTTAERDELTRAFYRAGHSNAEQIVATLDAAVTARVAAAVVQARAETEEWRETAMKFSEDYHAELNLRIEAEQARAEDRTRIEAALALVNEWEDTQAYNREHMGSLLRDTPTPGDFRAALTATEDGDH